MATVEESPTLRGLVKSAAAQALRSFFALAFLMLIVWIVLRLSGREASMGASRNTVITTGIETLGNVTDITQTSAGGQIGVRAGMVTEPMAGEIKEKETETKRKRGLIELALDGLMGLRILTRESTDPATRSNANTSSEKNPNSLDELRIATPRTRIFTSMGCLTTKRTGTSMEASSHPGSKATRDREGGANRGRRSVAEARRQQLAPGTYIEYL